MDFAYAAPKDTFIYAEFSFIQNVKATLGIIFGNFIGTGFQIDWI